MSEHQSCSPGTEDLCKMLDLHVDGVRHYLHLQIGKPLSKNLTSAPEIALDNLHREVKAAIRSDAPRRGNVDQVALDAAHAIEALPSDLREAQKTARIQLIVLDAMRGVAQASEDWHEDFRRRTRALSHPDQRLTEDMTLAHNARKTAIREMADFFNESVHHVWSNDEIASCLTDMISAIPGEETDDQIDERLAKQEAGDNLRLLDYIADKIGIPHNEELSRENFSAWLALALPSTPETTRNLVESLCEDCPPVGYPTAKTRCLVCPRRAPPIPSTDRGGGA